MKKGLITTLLLTCCILNATSGRAFAEGNGFFDRFKKTEKVEIKQIRIEKQTEEHDIDEINEHFNNNLLSPNESPGIITDPTRTRRYYDSVNNTRRTENKKIKKNKKEAIEKLPLQLPARIHEDQGTTHIESVEISESRVFSKEEINAFKSLVEGHDVTAEDLNNLILLINQEYLAKKMITARASLVAENNVEGGVLKIELMEAKIGNV